jgi:hypothetical protein
MRWALILVGVLILAVLLGSRIAEGFSNFTRQNPAAGSAERYGGVAESWGSGFLWGWPFWPANCSLAGCPGQKTCKADGAGFTFCS